MNQCIKLFINLLLGRGKDVREINVKDAYETIGSNRAAALLGFHSFTGCDFTAKFNGKSKKSAWKVFFNSDCETLYALRGLADTTIKIDEIVTGLETFVLNLYCKQRPNSVENLSSLRWYLFSKHQYNSDKLPPISSALNTKILRSHFVSTLWSQSHCSQMQRLDPTTHGWKRLIDESLQPITTDLPPAPEAIVEMSLCKCNGSCDTKRCACMKAGLVCTEMCFCQNCENVEHESEDENDDSDDDNEIDSDDNYIDSYDSDDD